MPPESAAVREWEAASQDSKIRQAEQIEQAEVAGLRARVAELERAYKAQGEWARSLEAAQQEGAKEIAHLRKHLRRVENGRVMRMLLAVKGIKRRITRF